MLRPDIEKKVKACEARAAATERRAEEVEREIDQLIENGTAVPVEIDFDDSSVVRHVNDLERARVDAEPALRRVAQSGYFLRRPSTR